jgi:hypothetical protein
VVTLRSSFSPLMSHFRSEVLRADDSRAVFHCIALDLLSFFYFLSIAFDSLHCRQL